MAKHNHDTQKHAPSPAELEAFAKQIDHMAGLLGEGFAALDTKARRRVLKPRKGSERTVKLLARLANEHGIKAHAASSDDMLGSMQKVEDLRPLADRVRAFSQLLDDMLLVGQGESWTLAVATYGMLRAASLTNATLQSELAPVRDFFRIKRKASNTVAPTGPNPAGDKNGAVAPAPPAINGSAGAATTH